MRRSLLATLLLCTALSPALAQTESVSGVVVLASPIPGGLRLDAGSGPRDFTCNQGRVHHLLKVGTRQIDTSGKYLVLTWQDESHFSMEAADGLLPLQDGQVRLWCDTKGHLQAKMGDAIRFQEVK